MFIVSPPTERSELVEILFSSDMCVCVRVRAGQSDSCVKR